MNDQLPAMYRAVQYIDEHLKSSLTVADIAGHVGYSVFHFLRVFNKIVHHTPYDYLMRRRLVETARELLSTNRRITDIALDYGYETPESFSRSFKRKFGLNPNRWRENNRQVPGILVPPKSMQDLEFINRQDFENPFLKILDETSLAGLMTRFDQNSEHKNEQRRELLTEVAEAARSSEQEKVLVYSYPDGDVRRCYLFAGHRESFIGKQNPLLAKTVLPGGKYAGIKSDPENRLPALNYLYFTWIPQRGYKPAGNLEAEFLHGDHSTILIPIKAGNSVVY